MVFGLVGLSRTRYKYLQGKTSRIAVMKRESKRAVIPLAEKLPPLNKRVMVVCKGFRCLGFLDRNKVWRDANALTELRDVTEWYDLLS